MEVLTMKLLQRIIAVSTGIIMLGLPALAADAAGKAAYDKACKSCHGADGTPNPAIAKMMKVEMKHLGAPEVQAKSDDDLKTVITKGEGKMKPITSVPADQVSAVVAYVRTLKH
jgi:mono/diheme cytochrome c family protein